MSVQSNSSIWKWKPIAAARQAAYCGAILTLLFSFTHGYGQAAATRTTLSVARDNGAAKLSVAVKGQLGAPISGGTVSFMSGGASLGSAFVDAQGNAAITVDQLPSSANQITAVYSGADGFAASASPAVQANATPAGVPDFSVTAAASSLNVSIGQAASTVLTVAPINCTSENPNCFTPSVALSISGLPPATSATFTPSSVIPANGAVRSTLQLQTSGPTSSRPSASLEGSHLTYALAFPGVLALLGLGALRKRSSALRLLGIAVLSAASLSGMTACSQRYDYLHHPPANSPGTPAGSYPLTITAYANNGSSVISHNLSLTLVVK